MKWRPKDGKPLTFGCNALLGSLLVEVVSDWAKFDFSTASQRRVRRDKLYCHLVRQW